MNKNIDAAGGPNKFISNIIKEYSSFIYNVAHGIVKNIQDAEDITQEVIIKIITSLKQLNQADKIRNWIYRITYHFSLNFERDNRHHKLTGDIDSFQVPAKNTQVISFEKEDDINALLAVVGMLPVKYRVLINLYYFKDHSYLEISDILDIPIGTVKTNLHRAKKIIRRELLLRNVN